MSSRLRVVKTLRKPTELRTFGSQEGQCRGLLNSSMKGFYQG